MNCKRFVILIFALALFCDELVAQTQTRESHLPGIINPVLINSQSNPLELYSQSKHLFGLTYDEVANQTFRMPSYYETNSTIREEMFVYYDRTGSGPAVKLWRIPYAKIYDRYYEVSQGFEARKRIRREVYLEFSNTLNGTINWNSDVDIIPAPGSVDQVELSYRFIRTTRVRRTGGPSQNPGSESPSAAYLESRTESGPNTGDAFTVRSVEAKFHNIDEVNMQMRLCQDAETINLYDYFTDPADVNFTMYDNNDNVIHTGNILDPSALPLGSHRLEATKEYANGRFSESITFVVLPPPSDVLTKSISGNTFCEYQTVTLTAEQAPAGTTYTYRWYNGSNSITGSTNEIQVSATGSYYVEITSSDGCIITTTPISLTVLPAPKPSIDVLAGNENLCAGEQIILTSSEEGQSYTWLDIDDNVVATTKNFTTDEAGVYRVNVTYENGCSQISDNFTVTVIPNPQPLINANGPLEFCEGEEVRLSATIPSGLAQYEWSNGERGPSITVTESGVYTVTAIHPNGCTNTSEQIEIVVNPNPVPTITASGNLEFCQGDSVTLIASGAAGYLWNTGEETSSITVKNPGNYYVTTFTTDGCERTSETVNITVLPTVTPVIEAIGDTEICEGETVTLQVTNAQAGHTYQWSNGQTGIQNEVEVGGNYYVIGINPNGCSRTSETISVSVNPIQKPQVTVSGNMTFCEGDSVVLTVTNVSQGTTVRWSDGTVGPTTVVKSTGNYIAFISNGECERAGDPLSVNVLPNSKPSIQALGPTEFCEGDSVTLSISNPLPGISYTWSNGQQAHQIKVKQNGQYYVVAQNDNGCSQISNLIDIEVSPLEKPLITTSGPLEFCQGESVTLTINQTGSSYRWSNGETTKSITISSSQTVTAYITNEDGCERASDPIAVTMLPNTIPNIQALGPTEFCEGDSVIITVTNPMPGVSYRWSNGMQTNSIKVKDQGQYYVIADNANGCSAVSQIMEITVNPIAKPTISANNDIDICYSDSIVLTIDQTAAAYRWNTGETTRSITVKSGGTYIGYIQNEVGCERASDPLTISVRDNKPVSISIFGNTTFCEGDSVVLTANQEGDYLWSNGATTRSITLHSSATVNLKVINSEGCEATSDDITITVHPLPKPTISANGPLEFCSDESVTLSIDQVASSYRWSNGATTRSITVSVNQTLTAYITNEEGCERASEPVTVVVNPNPTPTVNITGQSEFCEGDSTRLSVTPIAGYTYMWSDGQEGPSIYVSASGTYFVTAITPDNCTSNSDPVEITVFPLPKPTVSVLGQLEFCEGDSVTLTIDQEATGYRWSNGATTKSITVKSSANLIAYISNEEGCERASETFSVVVTPNPIPSITLKGSTVFCDGDSLVLTASPSVSYLWSNGETTQSITVKNPGDYYVVITNTTGCQRQSLPVSVSVIPNDVPTISSSKGHDICVGDTTILTASEGKLYRWSTGETTRSIRVTKSGNYTVTVVNDNDCERVSESYRVSEHEPIPLQNIPDFRLCLNAPEINLDSINTNNFENGRYSGIAVTHKFFNPEIAGIGFHEITYMMMSEYGCESYTSFMIEVVPLETIEPGPDTSVCINGPEVPLDAPGVPVETQISGQGVSGRRFIPSEAGIGTHLITYVYENAANCITTVTRTISVMPAPETPTVTGNQPVCANTNLSLTASSNVAGGMDIIYRWYRPDELEPFAEGKTISFTVTVNETIYVEAVSDKTCSSLRQAVNITSLTPNYTLNASATEVLQGTPVTFTLNELPNSAPAVRWQWDFGDGFASSENQPKHYFNKPGNYTAKVRAFSVEGCMAEKQIDIIVNADTVSYTPPENETEPAEDDRPFTKTVVYPNPVNDMAKMRTYNETQQHIAARLEIYTISGKLVSYENVTIMPGANEFELPDLNRLVAQTYYLVVLREDGGKSTMETVKILKL